MFANVDNKYSMKRLEEIIDTNMKYRGIKVLRSLDLLEGDFEM